MDGSQNEVTVDAKNLTASIKSASLNTIATMAVLIGVCILIWQGYTHAQDARYTSAAFVVAIKEQTAAIKEQTAAQREANCLAIFKDPANCQRIR